MLKFIRPQPNEFFNIHNPLGIKHLTRLRVGFSALKERKFRHNFQDSLDPMCNCRNGIETTKRFIYCACFSSQRQTLFDKIRNVDEFILTENENNCANFLLFGNQIMKVLLIK